VRDLGALRVAGKQDGVAAYDVLGWSRISRE
jgi:hypothetical protein